MILLRGPLHMFKSLALVGFCLGLFPVFAHVLSFYILFPILILRFWFLLLPLVSSSPLSCSTCCVIYYASVANSSCWPETALSPIILVMVIIVIWSVYGYVFVGAIRIIFVKFTIILSCTITELNPLTLQCCTLYVSVRAFYLISILSLVYLYWIQTNVNSAYWLT